MVVTVVLLRQIYLKSQSYFAAKVVSTGGAVTVVSLEMLL